MADDRADEIMRHFDVVAEGLRSEIKLVAEGHRVLAEGQGQIAQRLGRIEDKMEGFQTGVNVHFTELRSMI